jgi:hypothetical protein
LAKVCRKLLIPLPGRGYLAQKEAGQTLHQPPLPPVPKPIWILKPKPREEPPLLEDVATEQERAQVEKLEQCSSELVLKRGSLSHPLIVQARDVLTHQTADEREIIWTAKQCLDIRVSKASLDRALRIMAGFIAGIEGEGFTITVGDRQREKTVARIHGQQICFGLVETVERIELAVAPPGSVLERVLTFRGAPVRYQPSGQLCIAIWNQWGPYQKRWKDRKSARLEELLPKVLAGFIEVALGEKAKQEKREAAERERERIAEEWARLEQTIRGEESRVRALRQAAANWSRADQIRAFISAARDAACREGQQIEAGTPFGDWLVWAGHQADRIDPLKESPDSIIDRKRRFEPEYESHYPYRKREPPFRFPKPIWRMN